MMDIEALRAQTPGCAHRIHLNNAGAALLAQPTLDAMAGHLRLEAEIGGYEAAAQAQQGIAAAYAAIAELVGGRSEEVALFDNATHAWNAAFYSVPLGRGDRILTGRAEYGSNVLAYWQAANAPAPKWSSCPTTAWPAGRSRARRLAEERTRLIGVSHVPTSGGLVQPAAEIGKIARGCGALYLLDAPSRSQFPVDVDAIGCDMPPAPAQVPARPAGNRVLVGPHRGAGAAGPVRGGDRLRDLGRAPGFQLGPRSAPLRDLGTQLRQRPRPGRGRAAGPRTGPTAIAQRAIMLGTRLRDQLSGLPGVPRTTWARPAAPSSPPRLRTGPLKKLRQPWAAPGQRHHHRARGQPARHRRPRHPSPHQVLPALLQHRRRDRPGHRDPGRPDQMTGPRAATRPTSMNLHRSHQPSPAGSPLPRRISRARAAVIARVSHGEPCRSAKTHRELLTDFDHGK